MSTGPLKPAFIFDPNPDRPKKMAVYCVSRKGLALAEKIRVLQPEADIYAARRLVKDIEPGDMFLFDRLPDQVCQTFQMYKAHVFISAVGIAVRAIAPHLGRKTKDPAVVAMDDTAAFAVSVASGHMGLANRLAGNIARITGATPVVTTATDRAGILAVDAFAAENGFFLENTNAIKIINRSLLEKSPVQVFDPENRLKEWILAISETCPVSKLSSWPKSPGGLPLIVASDRELPDPPESVLVIRPGRLTVGMGMNRGSALEEIEAFYFQVLKENRLSPKGVFALGSIDVKKDEEGLLALAGKIDRKIFFYSKNQLNRTEGIQTPSAMVQKHVGSKSVCEAAAILTAGNGQLIVPKQKKGNVTMAVAAF